LNSKAHNTLDPEFLDINCKAVASFLAPHMYVERINSDVPKNIALASGNQEFQVTVNASGNAIVWINP